MSKNLSQQVVLDRRGFVAATFATVEPCIYAQH